MIDTIRIRLHAPVAPELLSSMRHSVDENGEIASTRGWIDNLKVVIPRSDNVTIISGSLRKFHFGETALDDLNNFEINQVMDDLSARLSISRAILENADLLRLDIGYTIQVEQPVEHYLENITGHTRIRSLQPYPGSIQISGANKKIIFYDKIREIKNKSVSDAKITKGGNEVDPQTHWLRFEVQYKKVSGVRNQLDMRQLKDVLTSPQPADEDASVQPSRYLSLQEKLRNEFDDVRFHLKTAVKIEQEINRKYLAVLYAMLQMQGSKKTLELVEEWKSDGILNSSIAYNLKKDIREHAERLSSDTIDYKEDLSREIVESMDKSSEEYLNLIFHHLESGV